MKITKASAISLGLVAATVAGAASITVDPTSTKQKIVGFGGGSVYYQSWITNLGSEMQEALYDTAFTGLNLSLLRVGNWLQDETASISDDATIIKAGKKRLGSQLKIEMSSWSAPASLKPSGSVNGSDANGDSLSATLNTSSTDPYGSYAYAEFAGWWKRTYLAYEAAGIAPDYISFQNEPDMFATYEETLFAPTETSQRAGYAQALNAVYDSLKSVDNPPAILGPEPLGIGYSNFQNYMKALDETKLDGYAYHLYHAGSGNDNSLTNYQNPENFRSPMTEIGSTYGSDDKPIIMTEFCSMSDNGLEEYMTGLAHIMQVGFSDGNVSGYIAWELLWGGGSGQLIGVCTKGWGECTEDYITISPEYHAMRHYSKFVNPGWRVVSTTYDGTDLYAVAFRSADCDSITVVAINESSSSLELTAPTVSGYSAIFAIQSVENGDKSKEISTSVSYTLPGASVTTFVYTTDNTSSLTCEDSPVVEEYVGTTLGDTVVIVDYSTTTDVSSWSGDFTVSYGTTTIDGVSGYAVVPLAGCEQISNSEVCDYQHALFTLSSSTVDALSQCSELEITMMSMDDTTTYVNVGGVGSEWVDYQYGRSAGTTWTTSSVSLDNESDNGSTKLKFNSNGSGVYISKIIAIGCGTTSINQRLAISTNNYSEKTRIFDMKGSLIWTGSRSQALNTDGTIRLNIPQGLYIVKGKSGTYKAAKTLK